jgi:hypothetical protein
MLASGLRALTGTPLRRCPVRITVQLNDFRLRIARHRKTSPRVN